LAATNIATHTLELGEVRFDWLLEKPQKQLRGQAPTPGTTENFDSKIYKDNQNTQIS